MLTVIIGVSKELVTKELRLLNVDKSSLERQDDSNHQIDLEEVEDFTSINNAELQEIDKFLDQEEFYYCQQPKSFENFYAKEPQDGDVWYPELD